MSINRVIISGRLTRDAEVKSAANGTEIMSFCVAVNDRRQNRQTGEWEDVPNFVECTMFGKRTDYLSKRMLKGCKVAVEGRLRWSQWEQDGRKRSRLVVVADDVELMTAAPGAAHSALQQEDAQSAWESGTAAGQADQTCTSVYAADIPF